MASGIRLEVDRKQLNRTLRTLASLGDEKKIRGVAGRALRAPGKSTVRAMKANLPGGDLRRYGIEDPKLLRKSIRRRARKYKGVAFEVIGPGNHVRVGVILPQGVSQAEYKKRGGEIDALPKSARGRPITMAVQFLEKGRPGFPAMTTAEGRVMPAGPSLPAKPFVAPTAKQVKRTVIREFSRALVLEVEKELRKAK